MDVKISELPTTTTPAAADSAPAVQGGVTKAFALGDLIKNAEPSWGLYGLSTDTTDIASGAGTTTLAADTRRRNVTLSGSDRVYLAGYRLQVYGTLTIGAGRSVDNDGAAGGAGTAGGSTGAGGGTLGSAASGAGGTGGAVSSNGSAGTNANPGFGGAGGTGGNSSGGQTGGAGGSVTLSSAWTMHAMLPLLMAAWNAGSWTRFTGGGGGGGSAGGASNAGRGGGQGGGLAWIAARAIVVSGTGRITARGGAGTAGSATAGGSAGGGGGVLVIFCESFTGPGGANDFSCVDAAGGAGGAAGSGGTAGAAGSAGKVLIFVKGILAYSSGF